jgi:hypothetical protein
MCLQENKKAWTLQDMDSGFAFMFNNKGNAYNKAAGRMQ